MNPDLRHLVTLSRCRRAKTTRNRAKTPDYEPVFQKLGSEDAIERVRERQEKAARLVTGLLAVPRRKRLLKLEDPEYRNTDLLALLLQDSECQQLMDPREALDLAVLAYQVALRTGEEGGATLSWAACLEVNARRLLGKPGSHRKQEEALSRAAKHLEPEYTERANYCRTAALVRWEQGRDDEAAALLQYAAALFEESGDEDEESSCTVLHGLLVFEQGLLADASQELYRGWSKMDWARHPLIALRAGLALVVCLAEAGQIEPARILLQETRKLYSTSIPPDEMLRIYWREALALAALQELDEAEQVLGSVQERLQDEESFTEAALVRLDLSRILAGAGREVPPEERLGFDLGPASPRVSKILQFLHRWLEPLAAKHSHELRQEVRFLGADLLRELRRCGRWIKPLPFA